MSRWARSGRVKIERAKEHIAALNAELRAFGERKPVQAVRYDDPETGAWEVRTQINETPPLRLGAIAGDAIHNLRSALDVLWMQVKYPAGGGDNDRKSDFSVFKSLGAFTQHHATVVRGLPKAAADIYRALKPYAGGNDVLWMLSEADNTDKHRNLIPLHGLVRQTTFDFGGMMRDTFPEHLGDVPAMPLTINWGTPVFPVVSGTVLYQAKKDTPFRSERIKFNFEIVFGEPEVLRAKPIMPTLRVFENLVDGIVRQFSAAGLLS